MGLKSRGLNMVIRHWKKLKSDQNGIEIIHHCHLATGIRGLKSDQNGIEIG